MTQLSDQLEDAINQGKLKISRLNAPRAWKLPALRYIGEDGKDHINAASSGATELGRHLSTYHNANFKHSICGPFVSMEGFMWYISTENDKFRNCSGHAAATAGRKLNIRGKRATTHAFYTAAVADGYWQYVNGNEHLKQLMIESTLPFDMYSVNEETGFPIRIGHAEWLCHTFELIRQALQQGDVYPGFDALFATDRPFGKRDIKHWMIDNGYDKNDRPAAIKSYFESRIHEHYASLIKPHAQPAKPEPKAAVTEQEALEAAKETLQASDEMLGAPGATIDRDARYTEALTNIVTDVLEPAATPHAADSAE